MVLIKINTIFMPNKDLFLFKEPNKTTVERNNHFPQNGLTLNI